MFSYFNFFFFPGSGKKNRDYKFKKQWAGVNIFYRLLELVTGRFEYINLPETMDARYLELCLISDGHAGIKEINGKIQNFQIIHTGNFTEYGYPFAVDLLDYNAKNRGRMLCDKGQPREAIEMYPEQYGIYAMNGVIDEPPISRILYYGDRLTSLQAAINATITNIRGSVIYFCTPEQRKVLEKMLDDTSEGKPVIISNTDRTALQERPEVLINPQSAETLKTLIETYDKTLADFLTEFGINSNAVINKQSGVNSLELSQNAEATDIALNNALKAREDFVRRINERYGTKIEVKTAFLDIGTVTGHEVKTKEELNDSVTSNNQERSEAENEKTNI